MDYAWDELPPSLWLFALSLFSVFFVPFLFLMPCLPALEPATNNVYYIV